MARAAPDGHTLLVTATPFTANFSLFKSIPYDPVKSFTPIIKVARGVLALAVHPSVPAHSTKEFIAHLKTRPGKLNYSSPGVGVPHHLAMELFKLAAKVNLKHVPYRGAAGATQDLVGGHVSAGFLRASRCFAAHAGQSGSSPAAVASRNGRLSLPNCRH